MMMLKLVQGVITMTYNDGCPLLSTLIWPASSVPAFNFGLEMQADMAKALLARVGAQPTALIGRMSIGYSFLQTPFWWDTERSGGPIVEQVMQIRPSPTLSLCKCTCYWSSCRLVHVHIPTTVVHEIVTGLMLAIMLAGNPLC